MKQVFFRKNILLATACLLVTFIFSNLNATVYYASPSGTGNGTLASPCSFASGLSKLIAPGDTLYLRDGIYSLSAKVSINKNGTATSRIGIMAYPGEHPILDFSTEPYGSSYPGISLSATSEYLHLRGLVIRYAGDNGLINNGSNHIIEACEFYGNCDAGLQHKSGGGNLILNCDSHDNFDYETGGILTANFGGNADGFADKQYTSASPNTYIGCRSWHNADDGWDFFEKVGNTVIKNCICYKIGPATFDMTSHPRYLTDKAWFDQFPLTVTNYKGGQDMITLASYINYGNGNGFKLGGNYTAHNVTLTRCLSVGNTVRGFDQNNNYGTMTLFNCSSYQNGYNYGFGTNSGGVLVIKNCASLSSINTNAFASKTVTNINNSWNTTGVTVNSSDFVTLDTSIILTPRNADGSFTTTFMNLVAGSDMIDAGLDVGIDYAGNHPDMGYFEYGTINHFPPVVTSQNTTQSVIIGSPIVAITFSWSGGATGLDTANIPSGITAIYDTINKTLTLQGTPAAIGSYQYTVTSIGGSGVPIVINGNIFVTSNTGKRIAYFTTLPITAPDSMIYNKLSANPDFVIVPVDATSTTTDYTGFDAVVMSPVPSSTAAGFPALKALDKPKLLLKPFTLKSTVWGWINTTAAINTNQFGVSIINNTHPIFSGLNFTGANSDQLQLFSTVSTYAVTGITNSTWIATPAVTVLGNAIGASTTNSIVEFPVGINMNGTITTRRFVMIGLSEYSTATLTATATQLIENTVYYILGMGVPLPVVFDNVNVTGNNVSATISWKVSAETNIKQYMVQRSSNGIDFYTIATVNADGNSHYTWNDNMPLTGKSFYRIVATENAGKEIFSTIVTLNNQKGLAGMLVLNNPVTDKKIHLQWSNATKGNMNISLYNTALQQLASINFYYDGGVVNKEVNIPGATAAGMYVLQVVSGNGEKYSRLISVQ